jgi:CRISPR-associated endonuclease/helicase Cas3
MREWDTHLLLFWGKTTHDRQNHPSAYHPLIGHMIDIAAVALKIWLSVLLPGFQRKIASSIGENNELGGRYIAWIAGLHDLGKASPPHTLSKSASQLHHLHEDSPFILQSR